VRRCRSAATAAPPPSCRQRRDVVDKKEIKIIYAKCKSHLNPSDLLMGENGATKFNAAHIMIEQGKSSTELEKKLLTPSASSIVLELLGRTANQKSSELGIIIMP
jgi:hypothetical protein